MESKTPSFPPASALSEPPRKRRRFRIQSEFGAARPWRSRKSRPCDTCRRRKTACIITTVPPCLFCKGRGLECQAVEGAAPATEGLTQDNDAISPSTRGGGYADAGLPVTENCVESGTESPQIPNIESETPESCSNPKDMHDADDPGPPVDPDQVTPDDLSPSTAIMAPDIQSPEFSNAAMFQLQTHRTTEAATNCDTLEDEPNHTAHSMGLAAEQDTYLLASFRSVIMNETNRIDANILQIYPGDPSLGKPPIHFSLIHDEFLDQDNIAKQTASDAIEAMVGPYGPILVRLFFKHVHPAYSVVSKGRFLRAYRDDKLALPASLRGAVYALASVFWRAEPSLKGPFPFPQWALIDQAYASLDRELDAPNLAKLQACLLLLHDRPADNGTTETPRLWTNTSRAVACAQMIGLHRDSAGWNLAPWERCLRRRLWWATYAADVWSSVAHGNPPHVYEGSFSTGMLSLEDLRADEDVEEKDLQGLVDAERCRFDLAAGARFIEGVRLSVMLSGLLADHFAERPSSVPGRTRPGQESLVALHTRLSDWHALLPQCLAIQPGASSCRNNGPLHLVYYATKVLAFRALMSPATMAAKSDPDSSLRRHFDAAVDEFGSFAAFMNQLTRDDLQSFWGRHARSQLILCSNFLIYLFLLASDSAQVKRTFRLLELFHESLQRLSGMADATSVGLIRPAGLRIDSFFTQAAQIMRWGSTAASSTGGKGSPG